MFDDIFESASPPSKSKHKEGELYKVITAYGKSFEIYYGYYEEIDRLNPLCDPMEIYPSFIDTPVYTDKGIPFVTAMQRACRHYKGESGEDSNCFQCAYYEKCEELLGICKCRSNHKK